MQTHTRFTLIDGSTFDNIKDAINHCEEMMGAETRDMLQSIFDTNSLYKAALQLVVEKRYDSAIARYVKWRDEHTALSNYSEYYEE